MRLLFPSAARLRRSRSLKAAAAAAALTAAATFAGGVATAPPASAALSPTRQAVVDAAKSYIGTPYRLETGWTCSFDAMDCECLNRHAVWDGTKRATGRGLQLTYTLHGQISQGYRTTTPRPGDLIFWDTDPYDGIAYGGDADHTGVYIGGGYAVDANAYFKQVRISTTTLGGTEPNPIYVDVLSKNGY